MPKDFGNTQDLIGIENIQDGTVVLKGGELRQIVMVNGINFALRSETEQNIITAAYQNFLNALDFPIQIIVHSRKVNIEKYLENLGKKESKDMVPLLKNQAEEYKEFIRGFVEKNAIMEKVFLVSIPFAPIKIPGKKSIGKIFPFFGKKEEKNKDVDAEKENGNFKSYVEQLRQRTTQVLEGLYSIGLEAAALNDNELIQLFYNFYNPETIEKEQLEMPTN